MASIAQQDVVAVAEGGDSSLSAYRQGGYQARCRGCAFVGPVRAWTPEGFANASRDGWEHGHKQRVEIKVPRRKEFYIGAALDWSDTERRHVEINAWSIREVSCAEAEEVYVG